MRNANNYVAFGARCASFDRGRARSWYCYLERLSQVLCLQGSPTRPRGSWRTGSGKPCERSTQNRWAAPASPSHLTTLCAVSSTRRLNPRSRVRVVKPRGQSHAKQGTGNSAEVLPLFLSLWFRPISLSHCFTRVALRLWWFDITAGHSTADLATRFLGHG